MKTVNSCCCALRPRPTPLPEEKSILGVIYGVLLWADMNAATPLGVWGRSVMSLDEDTDTEEEDSRGTVCALGYHVQQLPYLHHVWFISRSL